MNIYMKPELEWKLRAYSKKTNTPMAQVVEEALELRLADASAPKPEPTYTPPEKSA